MTQRGLVSIPSPMLGTQRVAEQQLVHFDGLPGFTELRRFAVLQHDRSHGFGWLLSVERPEVAFPVADPRDFFPGYRPRLTVTQLRALEAGPEDVLEWLAIGRVMHGRPCLNLAAPLVVNPSNRRGVQAILDEEGWSTREPLPAPVPSPSP